MSSLLHLNNLIANDSDEPLIIKNALSDIFEGAWS